MRAESRRRGRAIRRARRGQYVVMELSIDSSAFQAQINEVHSRLKNVRLTVGFPVHPLVISWERFKHLFGTTRPPRQLIHNGRAPKGRR